MLNPAHLVFVLEHVVTDDIAQEYYDLIVTDNPHNPPRSGNPLGPTPSKCTVL